MSSTIATAAATGTVLNDDPKPAIGATTLPLPIRISKICANPVKGWCTGLTGSTIINRTGTVTWTLSAVFGKVKLPGKAARNFTLTVGKASAKVTRAGTRKFVIRVSSVTCSALKLYARYASTASMKLSIVWSTSTAKSTVYVPIKLTKGTHGFL